MVIERGSTSLGAYDCAQVWRSHCDNGKEIEYYDFLEVLIESSSSQAHDDDY